MTSFPIFKDEVVLKLIKFAEEKHKGQTRKNWRTLRDAFGRNGENISHGVARTQRSKQIRLGNPREVTRDYKCMPFSGDPRRPKLEEQQFIER